MKSPLFFVAMLLLAPIAAAAQPAETEIPGLTAEVVELRLSGGVLRLAVRFANAGTSDASLSLSPRQIVLVDVKSKRKHMPLKTADNRFVVPNVNPVDGAMRFTIPAAKSRVLWAYFEPLPAGTALTVELPKMFPFDNVAVTEGPSKVLAAATATSNPDGVVATIVSARRADQALNVRLRLAPEKGGTIELGSYFEYKDVFLFDPVAKRMYPMLKDSDGYFQGQPLTVKAVGSGSFLPDWSKTTLMSLSFPAPPDTVKTVDLILPYFLPFDGLTLEGLGGAGESGIAAAGKTLGIEGALKDLGAKVTDTEIRIDLAADVLFDFDKAEIKKDAEPSLKKVATVLSANPGAKVAIEGHTDGKGADAYNQMLSEQRAAAVKRWLVTNAQQAGANITTRGWGKSKPIAHNARPDGLDDPEGRAKNRRVEIIVRKGG